MIVKKFQNTKNRMEKMQEKFNAFNNDMEERKKKKSKQWWTAQLLKLIYCVVHGVAKVGHDWVTYTFTLENKVKVKSSL